MDLEYKITTVAELAGAEAAADALERQIGKAKALKQDYSELQKELDTMRGSIAESKAAMEANSEASAVEGKETEKLRLGKRDLSEAIRGVTREYPMLGEVARAAFDPLVLAIFGIIEAFNIWKERIATLTEALGGIELPDLGSHIEEANNVAQAYDGVAKAVKKVDEEYDGAASVYERMATAAQAQLKATTALITALKDKAVAELDIEKSGGNMSEAEYAAKKSRIQTGASDATVQAEIDARNYEIQLKKDEQARAEAQAKAKTEKAAAFKLPESDEAAQAGVEAYKTIADAKRKEAEEAEKNKREIEDLNNQLNGGFFSAAGSFFQAVKFASNYGLTTDPEDAIKLQSDAESKAREDAARAEKQSAAREKEIKDRAKEREEAESAAALAEKTRLANEGIDDPNKVGSLAWQNAQAKKTQGVKDVTGAETGLAADEKRVRDDAKFLDEYAAKPTVTPADIAAAKAKIKDMQDALTDATGLIQLLASFGVEVSGFKAELKNVRQIAEQAKFAADHH